MCFPTIPPFERAFKTLISKVVHFLALPPFECSFEPYHVVPLRPFIFALDMLLITMRSFMKNLCVFQKNKKLKTLTGQQRFQGTWLITQKGRYYHSLSILLESLKQTALLVLS